MPNVLYLINHAGQGGSERYVRSLIEAAPARGFTPFFVFGEDGPLAARVAELGVASRRVRMRGPFDLAAAAEVGRLCREWRIDVAHASFLRENYVALLARQAGLRGQLKVVYTNHVMLDNAWRIKLANRLFTRRNHRIIAVCEAARARLIANGNDSGKIALIRNAVEPADWAPGAGYGGIRAAAREKYAIGRDCAVFLYAARFSPEKGHGFLLDAAAALAKRLGAFDGARAPDAATESAGGRQSGGQSGETPPDGAVPGAPQFVLLLAGDGPLLAETRARASALGLDGAVRFAGHVGDMKPLYYASDACVCPSRSEAASFMILEALACGLPVIATDSGGNGEIVNAENGNGLLVGYGDADALCAAMLRLAGDEEGRRAMGGRALRSVAEKFSLGRMLDETFEAYGCAADQ
jgi:glycosyltransferase involved in cell wall biosynthesis